MGKMLIYPDEPNMEAAVEFISILRQGQTVQRMAELVKDGLTWATYLANVLYGDPDVMTKSLEKLNTTAESVKFARELDEYAFENGLLDLPKSRAITEQADGVVGIDWSVILQIIMMILERYLNKRAR
jgi:hypothetical protein